MTRKRSFINYHSRGYWIDDNFVSLLARYLIEAHKVMRVKKYWVGQMKDHLWEIAMGEFKGAKILYLNEFLDDADKIEVFINWVKAAQQLIMEKGKFISKDEINSFDYWYKGTFVPFEKDLETKVMIELYDDIISIVKGDCESDIYSRAVLPFYR